MRANDIVRGIGRKVRAGRKRIGITRKQLAAAADVSERYLNELENGEANASVGILARVADALGEDFASLVAPVAEGHEATERRPQPHQGLMALIAGMSAAEQSAVVPIIERYLGERRRAARGIALIGLRGAGKSTLGLRLAQAHGLPFVSATREIEARAGMGLADLFNLGGPDAYRALENDVVADLCQRDGPFVLETAGGIVGNDVALGMVLAAFKTVWLKATAEEHLARVAGQGDMRPTRDNPKALEHVRALLSQREPEYARAEHSIDTSGRSLEACIADLERLAAPVLSLKAG